MAGAFVQGAQNVSLGAGPFPTISQSFPRSTADGNLLLAFVWWADITSSVSSVSDAAGNVWASLVSVIRASAGVSASVWICQGAQFSTQNKITATFSPAAGVGFPRLAIGEWTLSTGTDVSASAGSSVAGTSATVTSAITTNATDLVIGFATFTGGPGTLTTTGYTQRITDSGFFAVGDTNVVATGAQTYTMGTTAAASNWVAAVTAIKNVATQPLVPQQVFLDGKGVYRVGLV